MTYLESAKEAIRQLPESKKYIFGYSSKMHELYGIYNSVLRCDRQSYTLECFIREKENCIVLRFSLPFSYEEDRWDYVLGYLDCVNNSQKVKSQFILNGFIFCIGQDVVVSRSIDYNVRILTVDDLEQTLAEMIIDAELYYPVIRAIGLGTPVPEDVEDPPWIVRYIFRNPLLAPKDFPCDTKEPLRLYVEEYMKSQAFAEAEKKRLHPKPASDTAIAGQKQESDESSRSEEDDEFWEIMSIFNDDNPIESEYHTKKDKDESEDAEEEHIIELSDETLDLCGTTLIREKYIRSDDPEIKEKLFRMLFTYD